MLGGWGCGACSPGNVLKNCTIWCFLGPILAFKILLFVLGFFICFFLMLPLQTSLKTRKKKNLKCALMVKKAALASDGIVLITFWLQRKEVPA